MANSYVITRMESPYNAQGDYAWTVYGTVNGFAVTVSVVNSLMQAHLGSAIQFQNFMTPLLLDAFNHLPANAPTQTPPISSWSQ